MRRGGDIGAVGLGMAIGTIVVIALAWCALKMFLPVKAYAHDTWISREHLTDPVTHAWCCNEYDTSEETDNIMAVPGGYLVKSTGEVIPKERVIWRSPGGWWRARNLGDGSTRCLIGPPLGM